MQTQNNDLHNELMQLRNASGTHLTGDEQSILDSIGRAKHAMKGDARMVIEEICQILCLPDSDPVVLLETIRKLEKVVKAVPRMEGFIHNLSVTMADGYGDKPLPLEQILPRLGLWKQIVTHSQSQLEPLLKLKVDLTALLIGANYEVSEHDLLAQVE